MENKLIKVLTKNSIKCLICNTILESKHRHDFQQCNCSNKAFVDGGLSYERLGAMDLGLIDNLCEYRTLTQQAYDKEQAEIKAIRLAKNEQGVKDGLLVKIGGDYYNKETIALLCDYYQM
jgi:hypothetical protein